MRTVNLRPAKGHPKQARRIAGILFVLLLLMAGFIVFQISTQHKKISYLDIAYVYHGLVFDRRSREIKLDRPALEQVQDSMIASLTSVPEKEKGIKPPLDKHYVEKVLSGFDFTGEERMLTRNALIGMGLDLAPVSEAYDFRPQYLLLIERSLPFLQDMIHPLEWRPEYSAYISGLNLGNYIDQTLEQLTDTPYMADCRDNSVPIPPNYPTGGWAYLGELPEGYNHRGWPKSYIHTYVDPEGAGLCYAFESRDGYENLADLGFICQSETTGKACFWQNIDAATGATIHEIGAAGLPVSRLKNGYNLGENCTNCHRGYNAFLIHPNTPLGIPAQDLRDPDVRYTPIGRPGWSNPPPLLPEDDPEYLACSDCHEIPEPTVDYCRKVLQFAAQTTMPPRTADMPDRLPAGWDTVADPLLRPTITFLRSHCPS